MDGESEPEREVTRVPTDADLVSLARELNRLGVEIEVIDGVPVRFAGAELMLEMKQGRHEKDTANRGFVQQLIRAHRA